jgi:hypothetical protein
MSDQIAGLVEKLRPPRIGGWRLLPPDTKVIWIEMDHYMLKFTEAGFEGTFRAELQSRLGDPNHQPVVWTAFGDFVGVIVDDTPAVKRAALDSDGEEIEWTPENTPASAGNQPPRLRLISGDRSD